MGKGHFRWTLSVVVVLALLVALNLASTSSAAGPSAKALEKIMEVQDRHTEHLMAIQGVVGTATGLSADGGAAIKVYTKAPGIAGIPKSLDGVPVVVEVTGEIRALKGPPPGKGKRPKEEKVDPTSRFERPVPIGVSTGHPNITAGTIGARVKDAGGNVYALSNNHVYADENNASIGDNVLQPGPADGGKDPGDAIGTLAAFEPIVFSTEANNTIDAAIALSFRALLGNATPSDGYGIPAWATVPAEVDMLVQKYGRTRGLTKGVITGINATINVAYDSGTARFVNQIVVTGPRFIKAGDSGSLLVTDDAACNPVGLLFAGSISGKTAIANPIDLVLGAFGVTIDDVEATSVFEDNFDFYPVGLPPEGWTELYTLPGGTPISREEAAAQGVTVQVTDSVYFAGAQSVHSLDTSDTSVGSQIYHDISPTSSVVLEYYIRSDNQNYEAVFVNLEGDGGSDHVVGFGNAAGGGSAGYIGILGWKAGWIEPELLPYSEGTWYYVRRDLDCATNTGTFYVMDMDDPSNYAIYIIGSDYTNSHIDRVRMITSNSQGADAYVDELAIWQIDGS